MLIERQVRTITYDALPQYNTACHTYILLDNPGELGDDIQVDPNGIHK